MRCTTPLRMYACIHPNTDASTYNTSAHSSTVASAVKSIPAPGVSVMAPSMSACWVCPAARIWASTWSWVFPRRQLLGHDAATIGVMYSSRTTHHWPWWNSQDCQPPLCS